MSLHPTFIAGILPHVQFSILEYKMLAYFFSSSSLKLRLYDIFLYSLDIIIVLLMLL